MAYSTDDIILWGKISQPFALRGELKKKATDGEAVDIDLHTKLYIERKTVEWYNSQTTIDADILYQISNFLFSLEGIYGLQAQFVDGGSGGIVAPTTTASTTLPEAIDWTVSASAASATAPLSDGESSVTLNGTNGMPNLRGYNVEFTRNNATQNTTDPGDGSTYYSWNRTTGVFALLNGAAYTGERLRILPTR
jgi:hypothetical protein